MKRIALIAALTIIATLGIYAAGQKFGSGQKTTTNADTGTPVALSTTNLWVTQVTFIGKKSARTANTDTVWVGPVSGNDLQAFEIAPYSGPGTEAYIAMPNGDLFNLKDWYLDVGTADDGVVMIYQ